MLHVICSETAVSETAMSETAVSETQIYKIYLDICAILAIKLLEYFATFASGRVG